MKEEKVGQEKEELELIDFDIDDLTDEDIAKEIIDVNEETVEDIPPVAPVNNTLNSNTPNNNMSRADRLVENMQNFVSAITEPAPVEQTSTFGEIFDRMGKAKTTKEKIKIFLSEKRSRALATLMFWIVFMIVIVAIVKGGIVLEENNPGEKIDSVESSINELAGIDNFDYSIVMINNVETKIIAGSHFENRTLFMYKNQEYYEENNVYSKVVNDTLETTDFNLEINLDRISPSQVSKILKNSELIENITDKDGKTVGRSYEISAKKLVSYLYKEEIDTDKKVRISVRYDEDGAIRYIDINMSDIEELLPKEKAISSLNISYRNINMVTANDVTYDSSKLDEGPDEYYNGESESKKELEGE